MCSVYGPNDKITLRIFDENLFVSDYLSRFLRVKLIVKSKKGNTRAEKNSTNGRKLTMLTVKASKVKFTLQLNFSQPLWRLPITSFSARITQTFVIFMRLFHGNSLTALEFTDNLARFFNFKSQLQAFYGINYSAGRRA